ncbi:GerAB/ArcD/ProY family transporter [Lentibacillus cibarius]|uniref:GerAB/ArcD/ProY family transporter n=1 Tax=Lentibacillus cibarius TaxID=2583219 RepID=A0A549YI48_9BACI|nr:endospore germination permease [Lentibacillus cibarius]TRM11548.1 GerAB/ArcD/ProY family transporter [Lentibacillus cibarius]
MKKFEYADDQIGDKEIMIAIPSIVVGIGIITLPRTLAEPTNGVDGVFALVIGGTFAILMTWVVAKLAVQFPRESFFSYASSLTSKPVAVLFTLLFAIYGLSTTVYQTRAIASVSEEYLFERTPFGAVSLTFLLIVIYAVSGSRVGLFRLNMLFFPIVVFISLLVILLNIGLFIPENLLPVLTTDFSSQWNALIKSTFSFMGFGVLLFYTSLVKSPRNVPKKAAIGMSVAVVLYIMIFVMFIGVFGNLAAANLLHPTVELAKDVQIPGGFFERFESLFFVIWIMAIFNTTVMFFDSAIFALNALFKKNRKMQLIFILSPLIYIAGMIPQSTNEISALGTFISMYGLAVVSSTVAVLVIAWKMRGGIKK